MGESFIFSSLGNIQKQSLYFKVYELMECKQKHMERVIANKNRNAYLAEVVKPHRATHIAPSALLQTFSETLMQEIVLKHKIVEKTLRAAIGSPVYSDPGFILYCGDCVELLARIADIKFSMDLTVTSPPYNIGKEYEILMSVDDYIKWCAGWMNLIFQATKTGGAFWLNVGYLEVQDKGLCVPIPYLLWDKSPFYLLQEIVWKYGAGVAAKMLFKPAQ